MEVKLLHYTPPQVVAFAIRESHNSHNKSDSTSTKLGKKDLDLIKRIGIKMKHESVLEHAVFSFQIKGISRAVLQELARHRLQSLTIKSTRYTLKELRKEPDIIDKEGNTNWDLVGKYCVLNKLQVNYCIANSLYCLQQLVKQNVGNDFSKYALPEAYKTQGVITINLRSFKNMLVLRLSRDALWEFRELAYNLFKKLPPVYQDILLTDFKIHQLVKEYEDENNR
jgi:thymidylate synthase (FAD)